MKRFALLLLLITSPVEARVLMTQEQALAGLGSRVTRQKFFLTPQQADQTRRESGVNSRDQLIIRYATADGRYAYFDTHRVRTLPETIMVVIGADGRIERIDILSFDEPTDYFPKRRWLDQLPGHKLDRDLALDRSIRPLSGASLTSRAIIDASRKILALHQVLTGVAPR
jgi:uncharacterized protein with FMN-binding domain